MCDYVIAQYVYSVSALYVCAVCVGSIESNKWNNESSCDQENGVLCVCLVYVLCKGVNERH